MFGKSLSHAAQSGAARKIRERYTDEKTGNDGREIEQIPALGENNIR